MLSGMASGLTSGVLSGSPRNMVMGAFMGGLTGTLGGVIQANFGTPGSLAMMGITAGTAVSRGGLDSLAYMGAGMVGGAIGYYGAGFSRQTGGVATGDSIRNAGGGGTYLNDSNGGQQQIDRLRMEEGPQMAADYSASYYGYTPGTYDPELPSAGLCTLRGQNIMINYGPGAFDPPSMLQAIGFNESWKADLGLAGGFLVSGGGQLLNRVEIEMASEIATLANARRLDLTPVVQQDCIRSYNKWVDYISAPHYE